jgi:Na+-transporting NADH:ubiquinone oxidoreductase subunit D
MGRIEAFSLGNKPWPSALDGLGNGLGYGLILVVVAVFREFFGSGKIMGIELIPQAAFEAGYVNNNLMILPPMALIIVGIYIWIQRSRNKQLIESH